MSSVPTNFSRCVVLFYGLALCQLNNRPYHEKNNFTSISNNSV